jgi:hypothetical protein
LAVVRQNGEGYFKGVERKERKEKGVLFSTVIRTVFLVHADHDSWVLRTSNNGREDGAWSIIPSETCFAHSRSVIDHEGLDFFIIITHIY